MRTNNSIQISILSLQEARIQPQPDNTGRSENQVESQFTEAPTLTEIEVRAPPPTDALIENIVAAEVGFPNDSTQSSPSTTKTEEAENESLPTVVSAVSAEDIRAIITSEGINCNRELPLNSVFSKCDQNHEQLDFSVIDSNVVVDFYRDRSASGNLTATERMNNVYGNFTSSGNTDKLMHQINSQFGTNRLKMQVMGYP